MADDLIDFNVIEAQKENIQALPSGRSAKALAQLYSPPLLGANPSPNDQHSERRAEFERELANIDEADDPLDVYGRYVKWTLDTYPSAQATPQSRLLPLLERATKTFQSSKEYKNDPRYLKLWLHYIRLFHDAPREVFVFLARHGIGENLALYYEEFAAWLENAGRWNQAEEIYKLGIEKEARPTERLMRKFGEFERRKDARPQDAAEPSSPALPVARPALAAKLDPFSESSSPAQQAQPTGTKKPKSSKMAIFTDDGEESRPASGSSSKGWDSIGTLADRKKENTREAKPWAGETLKTGKTNGGMQKMMIFKDQSSSSNHGEQCVFNDKTGIMECVYVNLEALYPVPGNLSVEYCFEELRARNRGWLNKGAKEVVEEKKEMLTTNDSFSIHLDTPKQPEVQENPEDMISNGSPQVTKPKDRGFKIFEDAESILAPQPRKGREEKISIETSVKTLSLNDENDENTPPSKQEIDLAKKLRREERQNRTRKIKVMKEKHIKNETQTIKLNMDSPQSKPKRRKSVAPEPTMTIATKEAMEEIYGIFNQPLQAQQTQEDQSSDESSEEEDDYTTDGESTATGKLSAAASEYGDETRAELLVAEQSEAEADRTDASAWSDFTSSKHVPKDDTESGTTSAQTTTREGFSDQPTDENEDVSTPVDENPRTEYVPLQPEDYEPPLVHMRDMHIIPNHRLPFMTPIAEQTESSLGGATQRSEKDFFGAKTPSRKNGMPEDFDEDDELLSSPFDDITSDLPPIRTKSTKGMLKLGQGYYEDLDISLEKTTEIKKWIKSQAKLKTSQSQSQEKLVSIPPIIELPHAQGCYTVKRELGAGTFAPVYLIENSSATVSHEEELLLLDENAPPASKLGKATHRKPLEAIKMEDPPSTWEFYMLRATHHRLGVSRAAESIVRAHEMHLFRDECFLVEEFRDQGTLLDLVNIARLDSGNGGGMDEMLAMFFTIELLRVTEALHSNSLIHGDLKADNILIRFDDPSLETDWNATYFPSGAHGWSSKGITLIDFGRGIDMKNFVPDVGFIADWKTSEADCPEMRELRPWTYQIDYFGLAGIVHSLLFGRYMEVLAAEKKDGSSSLGGARKCYRIREALKRYWQTEIWAELFSVLLNPVAQEEGVGTMPICNSLKSCRERMEGWLEENCERGVGLKGMILRMEGAIRERKRKGGAGGGKA
ncbi:uncharacterized protein MYCFIDRAFT_204053 [Pseudocercospora fijiensis CIRAD86]|uniref:Protein kinase domain-containing protein n=1 Tax=Pseudocercospora fijiensis (strain CIRAD86) TaxID=383855 RepID=M2ZNQ5_PSEFD|nr:uncharacterized protein MYCFIDRAFT_204053 [Pseudocercospora fijiensis CIRAD86]EME80724.1 hypothetical protein MYCFIDRAFT_204053 [Pseudocercospora fijiensis CIRAD86]